VTDLARPCPALFIHLRPEEFKNSEVRIQNAKVGPPRTGRPFCLIAAAPPSETALLDFIRAKISPEMIHQIAMNDHGHNAEIRELAILEQFAPNPVLGVVPYDLNEALELEQWTLAAPTPKVISSASSPASSLWERRLHPQRRPARRY
jgi:hypothetical protein